MGIVKKFAVFFLAVMLCIIIVGGTTFAISTSNDEMEATLASNKEEYSKSEKIEVTLMVTNISEEVLTNVELKNRTPKGYEIEKGSNATKQVESLISSDSETLTTIYIPIANTTQSNTGDSINTNSDNDFDNVKNDTLNTSNKSDSTSHFKKSPSTGDESKITFWFIILIFASIIIGIILALRNKKSRKYLTFICATLISVFLVNISTQAFITNTDSNFINVETEISVGGTKLTLQGEVNYEKQPASTEDTVVLENFKADIYDIYLDTKEKVTFTVDVITDSSIQEDILTVYDENDQIIVHMNDDGVNGDAIANDGIYSGEVVLSSDEIQLVEYYASIGIAKSNSFEICFYRDLTQEEFICFIELHNIISQLSFNEACEYIEKSNEIDSYTINETLKVITYQSIYGIYGIWEEESDSLTKGNREYAIQSEASLNYNMVEERISSATIVSATDNKDVVVLRPFRSAEFDYDDFKTVGELLTKSLNSNLAVIDDSEVTVSLMKSLDSYGIVLIDSHGTIDSFDTPYIVTGDQLDEDRFLWNPIYYLQHVEYSADYLSGRIICSNTNHIVIGSKFLKRYYSSGSLNESYWFLGTCYSMIDDSLANTLIDSGASVVLGFTDEVYPSYCNRVLFETTLNSMILSADTINNGVFYAKEIYGQTDPDNSNCELKIKGNNDFRLVHSISMESGMLSGKVNKASDRNTPVSGANIYVYREDTPYKTLIADDTGNYTIDLPVGDYKIEITANGYINFTAYATVTKDTDTYMETFLMIEGSESINGIASGNVLNALTGDGIENVTLTILKGWNNNGIGDIITSITTSVDGRYTIDLPLGNYTVYATKNNYISTAFNIIVQEGTTINQNGTMTPVISGDSFRIVLTWGENPRDLDSHVEGILSTGTPFHVYYGNKSEYDGEVETCNLDVDNTRSYGPETITLNTLSEKPYYYYVHHYVGSSTLALSNAQIKVYQGENLVATFNVPTNQDNGDYWNVFAIVDGDLVIRNTITSNADTTYVEPIETTGGIAKKSDLEDD